MVTFLLGFNDFFVAMHIARNGPVYASITYRNFFLFLNFIPALINIYFIHLSLFFFIFLTVYPCFAFKNYIGTSVFPFPALAMQKVNHWALAVQSADVQNPLYFREKECEVI
jgi:hypothetical protein